MDVRDPRLVRSQDLTFSIIFCQEDFAFTQSSAPSPSPHHKQQYTTCLFINLKIALFLVQGAPWTLNKRFTIQRRLAWFLCKVNTHNWREAILFFLHWPLILICMAIAIVFFYWLLCCTYWELNGRETNANAKEWMLCDWWGIGIGQLFFLWEKKVARR